MKRTICQLGLITVGLFAAIAVPKMFAQEQPLVTEELPQNPRPNRPDVWQKANLPEEFLESAQNPLPAEEPASRPQWRQRLTPVFDAIEEIPPKIVEQAAYKFLRARFRLTAKDREGSKQPFRLMQDRVDSPELYWGKAVALHGHLTNLQSLPAPKDAEKASPWQKGRLKLWNVDETVTFVARKWPEDLPTGDDLHEPAAVIGYLFALETDSAEKPAPFVVARSIRRLKPDLDPESLAHVKDLTMGIKSVEESEAYYRTLLHAKLVDAEAQEQLAREFWKKRQEELAKPRSQFVDLFKTLDATPEIYRGQPVTLSGTLRELKKWEEMRGNRLNNVGIETVYEGWIFTEDSQSNPTVVVFTENPDQIPTGSEMSVPVKVTGYVFKMYGYESRDKENPLRKAPMLLAKAMRERHIPEPASFPVVWVGGAIGLLVLGIVLFLWSSHQSDKQTRNQMLEKDKPDEPPRFDRLDLD